jgi:hypothetical protein
LQKPHPGIIHIVTGVLTGWKTTGDQVGANRCCSHLGSSIVVIMAERDSAQLQNHRVVVLIVRQVEQDVNLLARKSSKAHGSSESLSRCA